MRCVFFAIVPTWDGVYFYVRMSSDQPVDTGLYVLEEFPTLLLITMYSQQLLVWARSYHMATHSVATYTGTVVGCVWVFNAAAYLMQVLIWALYDHTSSPRAGGVAVDSDAWSLTSAVLHAAEFFVIAGFLAGYGVGVHRTVHAAPVSLQMRAKQMRAIVSAARRRAPGALHTRLTPPFLCLPCTIALACPGPGHRHVHDGIPRTQLGARRRLVRCLDGRGRLRRHADDRRPRGLRRFFYLH